MAKSASKAKTLKDLNDQITSIKATQLEARVGDTVMGSYTREMDEMYREQMRSKLGTVSIPSLQLFETMAKGMRDRLIDLYDSYMRGIKGFEKIDDDIKFSQGALMDGLCYVYEMATGNVTLATMNMGLLCDLDIEFDMRKQIIEKNLKGVCKAYRIDVEYINGDQEFTFKAVNARNYDIDDNKPDSDSTKQFALVPYIAGLRMMKMCEALINTGGIVRIRQSNGGAVKIRFLTENQQILQGYCDDPVAVSGVESNYFPLKGFFYAPVIGAPSTTAMVSKVNIFNVDNIRAASVGQLEQAGIRKPTNPIRDLIGERYFVARMLTLKGTNPEEFVKMLHRLSYQGKLIKNPELIGASELSSYLHSVTPAAVEKAYRLVDASSSIDFAMRYFEGKIRPMTDDELENIEDVLRTYVCKFTIRKNDCSLGSVFATNCRSILSSIYGRDYVKVYESFGVKFSRVVHFFQEMYSSVLDKDYSIGSELWLDTKEELEDVGLPFSDDIYETLVQKAFDSVNTGEASFISRAKAVLAEASGVDYKRSEAASKASEEGRANGVFKCRSLTAYVDENGKVVEYYKNLAVSKIVSALIIE